MDVLCQRGGEQLAEPGRQRRSDHEDLFPAHDHSGGGGARRFDRPGHRVCLVDSAICLLSRGVNVATVVAASVRAADNVARDRRRPGRSRAERKIPRRAIRAAVSRAAMDVRFGDLSSQQPAREMEVGANAESRHRYHRRVSLISIRRAVRLAANRGLHGHFLIRSLGQRVFLPSRGRRLRRRGLTMTQIIKAENLSKRYRIGARQQHNSLRDAVSDLVRAPLRRLRNGAGENQTLWALKDVSFEVTQGEVLGVIGRNGAGKSTLLKILSRITKPTSGRVRLDGRVGSLLEVGTGFHSELTGLENVFLNGAILGMTKNEIEAKFDEIVAFAETGQFLDTPVKHYSSGMIVRLAFAVAAHLEPEILLIDEVLAVGDFAFQKKCLSKMNEVAKHGRTVLFVSHDLGAVNGLCTRAILLHDGQIIKAGATEEVTAHYLNNANKLYSPITWAEIPPQENQDIRLLRARTTQRNQATNAIDCRQPFKINLRYEARKPLPGSRMFFIIRNARGEIVFGSSDYDLLTADSVARRAGIFEAEIEIPGGLMKAGGYFATIAADIKNDRIVFSADDALQFDLFESGDDTMAERHKRLGSVAPLLQWKIREIDSRQDERAP